MPTSNGRRGGLCARGDDALDEFVVVVFEHDEAREGAAFLAEVAEGAVQDAQHGFVEVGVAVHDEAVQPFRR